MKTTVKLSVIRSVILLASCLALSQLAQAEPRFHGSLRARIDDGIMLMGDPDPMVMLMGADTETITHSDGDFAALGVKRGDTVTFDGGMPGMMMMIMLMPGWSDPGFTISSVPGWMWMGTGPATFSSNGPGNLKVTATGMTMGGGFPMIDTVLTFHFSTDEDGVVRGSLTLTASSEQEDD
jgi:hypothetical protein